MIQIPIKSGSSAKKQRSSETVEVFARIRKVCNSARNSCIIVSSDTSLKLQSSSNKVTQCQFTKVFDKNADQKDLFAHVAKPMVENLFKRKNGLLFTYGVTNSGKTYTMTGTVSDPGLLPRSLDMIFGSIFGLQTLKYRFVADDMNEFDVQSEAEAMLERQEKDYLPSLKSSKFMNHYKASKDFCSDVDHCYSNNIDVNSRYSVFVSYVEIYNEHIFDLLAEDLVDSCNRSRPLSTKRLREDKKKNIFVYGAKQVEVETTEEAFAAFQQGQERRRIAHTQLNSMSSRSHSIFSIKLVQAPMDALGEDLLVDKRLVSVSQLSLVDLAGSERLSRTGSKHERLREAGNINNSLMALRVCLTQLRENQKNKGKDMIKYRNSKLTHLFKSYFEGHGKVKMVLCLNPNPEEYEENFQVIQFAEIAQEVEVSQSQGDKSNQRYQSKLQDNKKQMSGSNPTSCSDLSQHSDNEWNGVRYVSESFPHFELLDCVDSDTLPNLIDYLEDRIGLKKSVCETVSAMSSLFRRNVSNGNLSNRDLRSRMLEIETELSTNTKEVARLERQVKKLESKNQVLTKTAQVFKKEKKQLFEQLGDVESQLKNTQLEKQQLQSRLPEAIQKTKTQVGRVYDRRMRIVQSEMEEQIQAKNERLDQLRNILCNSKNLQFDKHGHYVPSSMSSVYSQSSDSKSSCRRKSKTIDTIFSERKRSKMSSSKSSSSSTNSVEDRDENAASQQKVLEDKGTQSLVTKPTMINEHTNTFAFKSADKKISTAAFRMFDKRTNTPEPQKFDKRTLTTGPRMMHETTATTNPKMIDERTNTTKTKVVDENTITTPRLLNKQHQSTDTGQGDTFELSKEQENPRTLGCHVVNRKDENNFRHRPAAPIAPKYRRACCASSDNWLAHCPDSTIHHETILQPVIKPNRTVTVPSSKDVACATKYLLTHQCEDTDGELETQLVKGEVFHTRTGGQQVQFVDVETLKQSDPKKQTPTDSCKPLRNDYGDCNSDPDSSWTDVETRCGKARGVGHIKESHSNEEVQKVG